MIIDEERTRISSIRFERFCVIMLTCCCIFCSFFDEKNVITDTTIAPKIAIKLIMSSILFKLRMLTSKNKFDYNISLIIFLVNILYVLKFIKICSKSIF